MSAVVAFDLEWHDWKLADTRIPLTQRDESTALFRYSQRSRRGVPSHKRCNFVAIVLRILYSSQLAKGT